MIIKLGTCLHKISLLNFHLINSDFKIEASQIFWNMYQFYLKLFRVIKLIYLKSFSKYILCKLYIYIFLIQIDGLMKSEPFSNLRVYMNGFLIFNIESAT